MTHRRIPGVVTLDQGRIDVQENTAARFSGAGRLNTSAMRFSGESDPTWDTHRLQVDLQVDHTDPLNTFFPKTAAPIQITRPVAIHLSMAFEKNGALAVTGSFPTAGIEIDNGPVVAYAPHDPITFPTEFSDQGQEFIFGYFHSRTKIITQTMEKDNSSERRSTFHVLRSTLFHSL